MLTTEGMTKPKNKKKKKKNTNNSTESNQQLYTNNANQKKQGSGGYRGGGNRGGRNRRQQNQRFQPYGQSSANSNSANYWVAMNICSFCKQQGHQHLNCPVLAYKNSQRQRPQANLVTVNPSAQSYDNFGWIGMLTYATYSSLPEYTINMIDNTTINTLFYIDSGSNRFIVVDLRLLSNGRKLDSPLEIQLFNREVIISATHVGEIYITTNLGHEFTLTDVFYTPEGRCNILSIPLLQYSEMSFSRRTCINMKRVSVLLSRQVHP